MAKYKKNDDEFSFGLSTHAAWMLIDGIENYVIMIDRLYKNKIERADYCFLMICTAHREAVKVLDWAVENNMYNVSTKHLGKLIKRIERKRERFRQLEKEQFGY
ncbi:MAG: hypothetical protein GTO02_10255 [Candidatus Dadabacteria bacterium]|nr:hypothetical protein [Candidatus Dadabacteria bacterium]